MLCLTQMFGFTASDWAVVASIGLLFLLAICAGALLSWVQVVRIREEVALKARMLERGASVEEIERVLKATSERKGK
ncbi:hypothetical protein [Mucisphaera sp.]|uniref:hypothetical protein n=1 Tax=Mucisphaera sp. TaxID=2913024 RepID=UPI003D0FB4E2